MHMIGGEKNEYAMSIPRSQEIPSYLVNSGERQLLSVLWETTSF